MSSIETINENTWYSKRIGKSAAAPKIGFAAVGGAVWDRNWIACPAVGRNVAPQANP